MERRNHFYHRPWESCDPEISNSAFSIVEWSECQGDIFTYEPDSEEVDKYFETASWFLESNCNKPKAIQWAVFVFTNLCHRNSMGAKKLFNVYSGKNWIRLSCLLDGVDNFGADNYTHGLRLTLVLAFASLLYSIKNKTADVAEIADVVADKIEDNLGRAAHQAWTELFIDAVLKDNFKIRKTFPRLNDFKIPEPDEKDLATPESALKYLREHRVHPKALDMVAKSPKTAAEYLLTARGLDIAVKSKLEQAISQDAKASLDYALKRNCVFSDGERAMAENQNIALKYSFLILRIAGRPGLLLGFYRVRQTGGVYGDWYKTYCTACWQYSPRGRREITHNPNCTLRQR